MCLNSLNKSYNASSSISGTAVIQYFYNKYILWLRLSFISLCLVLTEVLERVESYWQFLDFFYLLSLRDTAKINQEIFSENISDE